MRRPLDPRRRQPVRCRPPPGIKPNRNPIISPPKVIPIADAAYRRPLPQEKRVKSRLKPLLLATGLALVAIFGASAIYGSPLNWTFPTTKSQAIEGLASAVGVVKADLKAITGESAREKERSAMGDLSAALTEATGRLDRIEHEYGARLDKLSERVHQDTSSRLAEIAARLDRLERNPASPATPASESADVLARLDKLEKRAAVATAPASEFADIATRLNKLEKRAAVPAPGPAKPLASASPKPSSLVAGAEPSASNETAKPDNPGPLLREVASRMCGTASRSSHAMVLKRWRAETLSPGRGGYYALRGAAAIGSS